MKTRRFFIYRIRMRTEKKKRGCLGAGVKYGCLLALFIVVIAVVTVGVLLRSQLYNRFVLFPKQAASIESYAKNRQPVLLDDGWTEYRGVLHSHSEVSHDSMVKPEDILKTLKNEQRDFIFLTDHCVDGKADYSLQWTGLHDGVLFGRGYEMNYGFMPWGLPEDTIFMNDENHVLLAKTIVEKGGVLFYAHSEEDRDWNLKEVSGMEIYNLHSDTKDEEDNFLMDLILNWFISRSYPDLVLRLVYDRQTDILKNWDELNETRKMVGIAATDAHQNSGMRGVYTPEGNLCIYDTGHEAKVMTEIKLNFFTRNLLRLVYGPLESNRQIFRYDPDSYDVMVRVCATHVLAEDLTEPAIIDALREGRAFVGFDVLADARGFVYFAETPAAKAVMGEKVQLTPELKLMAASPVVCKFILVHDGQVVTQQMGNVFQYVPTKPGKYRIEAELDIAGESTPWVYTNPIEVTQ